MNVRVCAETRGVGVVLTVTVMAALVARPVQGQTGDAVHALGFHTAPPLQLEPGGQTTVKAWYRELPPGRANDQSPWKQLWVNASAAIH